MCGLLRCNPHILKKKLDKNLKVCYIIITKRKGEQGMTYEVYPCDLDPMGECPKRCQDCAHCVGWNFPPDADEDE
jgi:hypothetical protein